MFEKLWNRILARPEPKRPVREVVFAVGLAFGLTTLLTAIFPDLVPQTLKVSFWTVPLKATMLGAQISLFTTGVFLLGPLGRKRSVIALLVILPIVVAVGLYLFGWVFSGDTPHPPSERTLTLLWIATSICVGMMIVAAGCGWFQWFRRVLRR